MPTTLFKTKTMNKLLLIPFIFFTFLNTNSQNFKGIIEYGKRSEEKVLTKEDIKRKKENPEKHKRFQKMNSMYAEGEKKLIFKLKIDNNASNFKMKPLLKSVNSKKQLGPGPYDRGIYFNKDFRILQLNAFGELFLISKPKLIWKIYKENKKIGNYVCLKATTEISINSQGSKELITAWFTPKIPLSFGPLGYDGLPGLILELEIHKKIYFVKKLTLNPKEQIKTGMPTKGVKLTEKEFQKVSSGTLDKFRKNRGY